MFLKLEFIDTAEKSAVDVVLNNNCALQFKVYIEIIIMLSIILSLHEFVFEKSQIEYLVFIICCFLNNIL